MLMNSLPALRMLLRKQRSRFALLVILASAMGIDTSIASAELVTFYFAGELDEDQSPSFPFRVGQKVHGSYTFERTTLPDITPNDHDNRVTFYFDAVKNFTLTIDGIGTGQGTSGYIYLGNPVQTTGGYNFLSDLYELIGPMSGIKIATPFGDRHLQTAFVRLQDIDSVALTSEKLSANPPNLALFQDHLGPTFESDHASILMNFDFPGGGINTVRFRLTSLTVPEPSALLLALLAAAGIGRHVGRSARGRSLRLTSP
jgi:hypothetical protein